MSGWLLILALLLLGGVLSTLGDRLGSKVGKARLSLFRLRPRNTAVVITALTGALISAVSLGLMLLVSERLRVGLFELDQLQERLRASRIALERSGAALSRSQRELSRAEAGRRQALSGRRQAMDSQRRVEGQLQQAQSRVGQLRQELQPLQIERSRLEAERARLSDEVQGRDVEIRRNEAELQKVRQRIAAGEQELRNLEGNIIALRRGDVVIASGEPLAMAKVKLQQASQAREVIDALLQQANISAYQRLLPGQKVDRQILLVPRNDIARLSELLARPGTWVVSIRSASNVVRGEQRILAFPDLRPNRSVTRQGDVLARTTLAGDERSPELVRSRVNLLLAAAYAQAQRQGTLVAGLQFDGNELNQIARALADRPPGEDANLEAVARSNSDTIDPIVIELRWPTRRNPTEWRPQR
ncbi:MAG: DUF3084 domain-containing protein [Synechococcus sp.]|nr:DUF3084 domain-containing protein [Synechococcus sp.]